MKYFIVANSFAAPFVSDTSTTFQEAETPEAALEAYAARYSHPAGLYAAEAYASANDYHKNAKPLAQWLCNHELAKQNATKGKASYSAISHAPGDVEVDDQRISVLDPKGGRITNSRQSTSDQEGE